MIVLHFLLILVLCGCTQNISEKQQENYPFEVTVGTSKLSYYNSTLEEFEKSGLSIAERAFYLDDSGIIVSKNKVRAIIIKDDSVTAYKGITIGDTVDKLYEMYKNVKVNDGFWYSYFKGNTEIDVLDNEIVEDIKNNPEDYICISGSIKNNIIDFITIGDYTYARTGK